VRSKETIPVPLPDRSTGRQAARDVVLGPSPQLPVHRLVAGQAIVDAVRHLHQSDSGQEILHHTHKDQRRS
jgi:hypothetical protein